MGDRERASDSDTSVISHILVIPLPAQGHINPMFELAKRLTCKDVRVTFVSTTTGNKCKSMADEYDRVMLKMASISDGSEQLADDIDKNLESISLDARLEHFKFAVSRSLANLIEELKYRSLYPPKFIIYDSVLPWVLDIARKLGLDGAPFFTQSAAVNAIYHYYYHHNQYLNHSYQVQGQASIRLSTPLPPLHNLLGMDDLPWFVRDRDANARGSYDPVLAKLAFNQFSNFKKLNWLFYNTFDDLEQEVIMWMESHWPMLTIKNIGPTIPSMYLDKRMEDDKDYGTSLISLQPGNKNNVNDIIKLWLDSKPSSSVVYVSFGSLAALGEEQMEELAWGLKRSNHHFLWVVTQSQEKNLPSNFLEELEITKITSSSSSTLISSSENNNNDHNMFKGLIVNWCSQLQVLAHKAVGCFVTHCGWNSTLEALSLGVPMVAMPQWSDQPTNAKFIADIWKVGVRVKVNDHKISIVTRQEIEMCIRKVMELGGQRITDIRRNSERWKKLAKEAVDQGGSSDKKIQEFVAKLAAVGN